MRQVINHLIDTERVFVFRALWFARGFDSPLAQLRPGHRRPRRRGRPIRVERSYRGVPQRAPRHHFVLPQSSARRVAALGIASDNRFTVRALAFIAAGHTAYHFKILRERYGI